MISHLTESDLKKLKDKFKECPTKKDLKIESREKKIRFKNEIVKK